MSELLNKRRAELWAVDRPPWGSRLWEEGPDPKKRVRRWLWLRWQRFKRWSATRDSGGGGA
jgi:hypothetical protein